MTAVGVSDIAAVVADGGAALEGGEEEDEGDEDEEMEEGDGEESDGDESEDDEEKASAAAAHLSAAAAVPASVAAAVSGSLRKGRTAPDQRHCLEEVSAVFEVAEWVAHWSNKGFVLGLGQ